MVYAKPNWSDAQILKHVNRERLVSILISRTESGNWTISPEDPDPPRRNASRPTGDYFIELRRGDNGLIDVTIPAIMTDPIVVRSVSSAIQACGEVLDERRIGRREQTSGKSGLNSQTMRRLPRVTQAEASEVVAKFEAPIGSLSHIVHSGDLAVWDEDFVRNTVQQIALWRQRDEASPQIFELLIADVVSRLLSRLTDPEPLSAELQRLGADLDTANLVSEKVVGAIDASRQLGQADPVKDAEVLDRIAASTERAAAALEGIETATTKTKSFSRSSAEKLAGGAAGAVGKSAAETVLGRLRGALDDDWTKLQIGLVMAWRAVKSIFVQ